MKGWEASSAKAVSWKASAISLRKKSLPAQSDKEKMTRADTSSLDQPLVIRCGDGHVDWNDTGAMGMLQ